MCIRNYYLMKMQVVKHNVKYGPIHETINVYVDMDAYSCRYIRA